MHDEIEMHDTFVNNMNNCSAHVSFQREYELSGFSDVFQQFPTFMFSVFCFLLSLLDLCRDYV